MLLAVEDVGLGGPGEAELDQALFDGVLDLLDRRRLADESIIQEFRHPFAQPFREVFVALSHLAHGLPDGRSDLGFVE